MQKYLPMNREGTRNIDSFFVDKVFNLRSHSCCSGWWKKISKIFQLIPARYESILYAFFLIYSRLDINSIIYTEENT